MHWTAVCIRQKGTYHSASCSSCFSLWCLKSLSRGFKKALVTSRLVLSAFKWFELKLVKLPCQRLNAVKENDAYISCTSSKHFKARWIQDPWNLIRDHLSEKCRKAKRRKVNTNVWPDLARDRVPGSLLFTCKESARVHKQKHHNRAYLSGIKVLGDDCPDSLIEVWTKSQISSNPRNTPHKPDRCDWICNILNVCVLIGPGSRVILRNYPQGKAGWVFLLYT